MLKGGNSVCGNFPKKQKAVLLTKGRTLIFSVLATPGTQHFARKRHQTGSGYIYIYIYIHTHSIYVCVKIACKYIYIYIYIEYTCV